MPIYAANYALVLEDASSKSNFLMKENNVFVCLRFYKFFHLTKLFKLLEFFKFDCFNLRKRNTNLYVHDFDFSTKKILQPLITFILMRHAFLKNYQSPNPTLCSNFETRKQINPTKGTCRKYLSHFCS